MIGQTKLIEKLYSQVNNDNLPRFIIFVGPKGSGKKELCALLSKRLGAYQYDVSPHIEDIRSMRTVANSIASKMLFVIADGDNMSLPAKNALLKITEEPPNNAYIVLTLQDIHSTLDTIRSRGSVYYMEQYSVAELYEYAKKYNLSEENNKIVGSLCSTPLDVDILNTYGYEQFLAFINKVIDNIATVSGANAFKIGQNLKLSANSSEDKYDLVLFFRAFSALCVERYQADANKRYIEGVIITSKYRKELRNISINKSMCFDAWLLEIRKSWM